MEFNSYEVLKKQKVAVNDLLKFHFKEIGNSIKRKITTRQVRSPGRICIKYKIPPPVYREWYRAVRDHIPSFGFTCDVKRNKKNLLTHTNLKFLHLGTIKFHFAQVAGDSNFFTRKINKVTGSIVVSEEKPVIFNYNVQKGLLSINLNFELINRYGHVCI